MLGLSDGERISMTRSAVLTQYTRVTDGQTDSALEVFLNVMRYINPRFTYLLTYLLTYLQTDGQTELARHIRAIAYMLSRVKISTNTKGYKNLLNTSTTFSC